MITELPRRTRARKPTSAEPIEIDGGARDWGALLAPMIEPRLARATLGALVGRTLDDGPLDVAATIAIIARNQPIRRVPRRRVRTLRYGAQLLVDAREGMQAFASDTADVERRLRDVVGRDSVEVRRFRIVRSPDPSERATLHTRGHAPTWTRHAAPGPGTPVLVLTDLGLSEGGLRVEEEAAWLEFATTLTHGGSPLLMLTPCPPELWPVALAAVAKLVQWDRATARPRTPPARAEIVDDPETEDELTSFARTHPNTYELARLVALTSRCEPALLRALRRQGLPHTDAWIEGLLWSSALVEARSLAGLRLRADVTRELLATWRGGPQLEAARLTIANAHAGAPRVIQLHEELIAALVRDDENARRQAEQTLARITAALTASERDPDALSRWALHVLRRLPASIVTQPAGFSLALAAGPIGEALIPPGVHPLSILDAGIDVDDENGIVFDPRSRAEASIARVRLGVRGIGEFARFEVLAPNAPMAAVEIAAADTRPALIEVQIADTPPVLVACGDEAVNIRWPDGPLVAYALDGRGWRLTRAREIALPPPWSSIVSTGAAASRAFGYVASPHFVVVLANAADPDRIEPIEVRIDGVTQLATLAIHDASSGVAVLMLREEAAVTPLAFAIAGLRLGGGVLALAPDGRSHAHVVPTDADWSYGAISDPTVFALTPGLPVIGQGGIVGLLGDLRTTRDGKVERTIAGRFTTVATVRDADVGAKELEALASLVLRGDVNGEWRNIEESSKRLLAGRGLADAALHQSACGPQASRAAALMWWASRPSRHAVPHALAALDQAESDIYRRIAISALEALARRNLLDAVGARRALARLDVISRNQAQHVHGEQIAVLHDMLTPLTAKDAEARLPYHVVPRFVSQRALAQLVERVRGPTRVLALTGGIDGSMRLGIARHVAQSIGAPLTILWSFRIASFDAFCEHLAGVLGMAESSSLEDLATAAAAADATILLDRPDIVYEDQDAPAPAIIPFIRAFALAARGHCVIAWPSDRRHLPSSDAVALLTLDGFPVEEAVRDHLAVEVRTKVDLMRWVQELAAWGQIAATAALVRYLVHEWLPLDVGGPLRDQAIDCWTSLRGWLEYPAPLERDVATAFASKTVGPDAPPTIVRFARVWLELVPTLTPPASNDPTDLALWTSSLARVIATVASFDELVPPWSPPKVRLQDAIRDAYRGTPAGADICDVVFAFETQRAGALVPSLSGIIGDRHITIVADDKLAAHVAPDEARRIRDQWRLGSIGTVGDVRVRWIAERDPFPVSDDRQKGRWGGLPEANGRVVTATLRGLNSDWFAVLVEVAARPGAPPIVAPVRLHLHESFPDEVVEMNVSNGIARFETSAWGAFTLGVECDKGATQLELDLADLRGIDDTFRNDGRANPAVPAPSVHSIGVALPLGYGSKWTYAPIKHKARKQVMRVAEHVVHSGGTIAAHLENFIARRSSNAADHVWLLTRGDGAYFAIAEPNRATLARLQARDDELLDLMIAEHLYVRLPARAGSSFANAYCTIRVESAAFREVRVKGLRCRTVVYDLIQEWPAGEVRVSLAPNVGILSVTDIKGLGWQLDAVATSKRKEPATPGVKHPTPSKKSPIGTRSAKGPSAQKKKPPNSP
ncbi:MAG: hypothetical protein K8W52_10195 [Deltaproteobacteria bacterium]|nr:hypothetical protein [Deltaproteobacteria bacterium]